MAEFAQHTALTTVFEGERAKSRSLRKAKLTVVGGPDEGARFDLEQTSLTIGRSDVNDITLQDKAISGAHCKIIATERGYVISDLDSRNGIYFDSLRVEKALLYPGVRFKVGHTEFVFSDSDEVIEIALSEKDRFGRAIGVSPTMREIFAKLDRIAPSELTCLVTGETGTGKELVARGIHENSPRKDGPFIVLDCGAIPRELIESTFFGHEKGSFTGAVERHTGCFEQAHGGTIFIDEIGELDLSLQPKLLRVLEQREVTRVGGDKKFSVDVRVLAATNRDLRQEVSKGNFREDLYFRLSVVQLELPPLRTRMDDIPLIAQAFLHEVVKRRGVQLSIGVDAMRTLQQYPWPGNVRELRNVVERAAALSEGPVISREDLMFGSQGASILDKHEVLAAGVKAAQNAVGGDGSFSFDAALLADGQNFKESKQTVIDAFEGAYLKELIDRHSWNITKAAQHSGLTRYHLRELLKRHGLKRGE